MSTEPDTKKARTDDSPASTPQRKLWVNLHANDLEATVAFWKDLGFAFEDKMSNDKMKTMILNDATWVQWLSDEGWKGHTGEDFSKSDNHQAMMAITCHTPEELDSIIDKAVAQGCTEPKPRHGNEKFKGGSFVDLNGYYWGLVFMSAMPNFEKKD